LGGWGTLGEHDWNTRIPHWEQKRKKKTPPHPKTQETKKKTKALKCILSILIGCLNFLFSKLLITTFNLGSNPFFEVGSSTTLQLKNLFRYVWMTSMRFKCFFTWRVFAEFGPEKYDFDLYKGFFMGKTAQICQIFEI
jgi:hypothetical protein